MQVIIAMYKMGSMTSLLHLLL